jgi:CrcB protein
VGWLGERLAPGVRLALFTGVLGGFTTFSTFALESTVMIRAGDTATGIGYIAVSVAGGVALAMIGLLAGEGLA